MILKALAFLGGFLLIALGIAAILLTALYRASERAAKRDLLYGPGRRNCR